MSIRLKVLGAILVTFLPLFITIFAISQSVLLSSFAQLEQKSALENITRVQNVLQDNVTAQLSTNGDWATWSDTYEFIQGNYPEYAADNLYTDAIVTLNLNMLLFVTNDGAIYASKVIDLEIIEDIEFALTERESKAQKAILDQEERDRATYIRLKEKFEKA